MKPIKNLSIAAAVATLLATAVVAQENSGASGQMMDGKNGMSGNMMQGDMSGMDGMMPMMKMMQACTEMMEAMNASTEKTQPSINKG